MSYIDRCRCALVSATAFLKISRITLFKVFLMVVDMAYYGFAAVCPPLNICNTIRYKQVDPCIVVNYEINVQSNLWEGDRVHCPHQAARTN